MERGCWRGTRRTLMVTGPLLALGVMSFAAPAMAQEVDLSPRGIDRVCPAPDATIVEDPPTFNDLDGVHADSVLCAGAYGLVSGYPDGQFRPGNAITRGQMATFVVGWIEAATNITLDIPEEARFDDAEQSVHSDAIGALAEAGIVSGRADGSFGPGQPLTRGQFARAIGNAVSYADVFDVGGPLPPPVAEDATVFADINGTTFEAEIEALANTGIAVGANGSFRPDRQVTRGQLATFLMRAADYLDRYERWYPTHEVQEFEATLAPIGATGDDGGSATQPSGEAILRIDAFQGRLVYTLDLSRVPGPYGAGFGAAIHLGEDGETGPEVIQLADGPTLDTEVQQAREQGVGAVVVGAVPEKDSRLRFAELLEAPEQVHVVVATSQRPNGAVRGQLTPAG